MLNSKNSASEERATSSFSGPVFQDVLKKYQLNHDTNYADHHDEEEDDQDGAISMAFFELANAPEIAYRLSSSSSRSSSRQPTADSTSITNNPGSHPETTTIHKEKSKNPDPDSPQQANDPFSDPHHNYVILRQDNTNQQHTGGIVWETSFLLLTYLLNSTKQQPPLVGNQLVEVGAGMGLLGLVLALEGRCHTAILTDTDPVLALLANNVSRHEAMLKRRKARCTVCRLDWEHCERDIVDKDKDSPNHSQPDESARLRPHSADTIVGTDVVFAPHLVRPLLQTCTRLAHDTTVMFLCLQQRCATSYQLLIDICGPEFGWVVQDISQDVWDTVPECAWGEELECHVLCFQRESVETRKSHCTSQKRRRKQK